MAELVVPGGGTDTTDRFVHSVESRPHACPGRTAYTRRCSFSWSGTVTFERRRGEQPQPPEPSPPQPPAPRDPGPIPETEQEAIAERIVGVVLRGSRAGRVTATCTRACTGKVSAYAVALRERRGQAVPKPKPVGRAQLRPGATGGGTSASVRFSPTAVAAALGSTPGWGPVAGRARGGDGGGMSDATPLRLDVVTDPASTHGAYALLDVHAPAGAALPPHVAAREDCTLLVLAGELEVVLAAGRRLLGPGDELRVPRTAPRRLRVLADAHLLCLSVPAGLERLTELVGVPLPDRDDVAALLAAAGVTLLPAGWGAGPDPVAPVPAAA